MILLGSGRLSDVYALDDERVLRRSRHGGSIAPEVAIMKRLHALGFPVPAVYSFDGGDIVMQRLHGPTMVQALASGQIDVETAAGMLAALHDRLHQTPIVHLDLHPENVMLTPDGPFVIDWSNAAEGEADLDLAMTAVIVAQVALDPAHPLAGPAREFLQAFLAQVTGDPVRLLPGAMAMRAADPALTAQEVALLPRAESLIRALGA